MKNVFNKLTEITTLELLIDYLIDKRLELAENF